MVSEGGSGSGSSGYDYEAERRAQEQAEAARRAEAERQAELERQRREAENQRRLEEAARQAKFLEDRDATAGTLRGSSGAPVSAGSGLRGSTATSGGTELRGSSTSRAQPQQSVASRCVPSADPKVVDACNVPSGLPKSVENQIPDTPAGRRIRKAFQIIIESHDWPVAIAWFKDALRFEPNDPGILRLIDLAEYTLHKGKVPPPPAPPRRKPTPAEQAEIDATKAKLDFMLDTQLEEQITRGLLDWAHQGLAGQERKPQSKKQGASGTRKQPVN